MIHGCFTAVQFHRYLVPESLSITRGSILNLNVWSVTLSDLEMIQMTKKSGSFKCAQIVSRDYDLMLRWRDLLNYASAGLLFVCLFVT